MAKFTFVEPLGEMCEVECDSIESGREIAAHRLGLNHGSFLMFTVDEIRKAWEKFFPADVDVVEVIGSPNYGIRGHLFEMYPIGGYDRVWIERGRGYDHYTQQFSYPPRQLIIRIPEHGRVRCPERFMGRVIGRKGVKINELSKKHDVKIQLIRISDID